MDGGRELLARKSFCFSDQIIDRNFDVASFVWTSVFRYSWLLSFGQHEESAESIK